MTAAKVRRGNIRLSSADVRDIQALALRERCDRSEAELLVRADGHGRDVKHPEGVAGISRRMQCLEREDPRQAMPRASGFVATP